MDRSSTTSINSENDEEGGLFLPPRELLIKSRVSRLVSNIYHQDNINCTDEEERPCTLSSFCCLTISYILGIGYLAIPYVFTRSGVLLGLVIVTLVTVMSYMTVMWVAETGARYELIKESQSRSGVRKMMCHGRIESLSSDRTLRHSNLSKALRQQREERERAMITNKKKQQETNKKLVSFKVSTEKTNGSSSNGTTSSINLSPLSTTEKSEQSPLLVKTSQYATSREYEMIDLISFFLGTKHKYLYETSLIVLMYIGLLAYCQVFLGSYCSTFHSFSYALSILMFGIMVIPLSFVDLVEHISIQILLVIMRLLVILIMFSECLVAIMREDTSLNWKDLRLVDFTGFGMAFSVAIFSQSFHFSVPGLLRSLQEKRKERVSTVFAYSLITSCILYLMLGITGTVYFGNATEPTFNLNFEDLHQRHFVRIFFTKAVIFFPALDAIFIFPQITKTLGNILLAVCENNTKLSAIMNDISRWIKQQRGTEDQTEKTTISQDILIAIFRLIASFPPLMVSLFATDLANSIQLAGIPTLYIAFFAPALLQLSSFRAMLLTYGEFVDEGNLYAGWYSKKEYMLPVLSLATFSLFTMVYHLCNGVVVY